MLETKCVGDNFEMLVTVNISFGHQQPKDVINIEILSPTSKNWHQDKVTNINVAEFFYLSDPSHRGLDDKQYNYSDLVHLDTI